MTNLMCVTYGLSLMCLWLRFRYAKQDEIKYLICVKRSMHMCSLPETDNKDNYQIIRVHSTVRLIDSR